MRTNAILKKILNLPLRRKIIIFLSASAAAFAVAGLSISIWLSRGGKDKLLNILSQSLNTEISAGEIKAGFGRLKIKDSALKLNGKELISAEKLEISPSYSALLFRQSIEAGTIKAHGVKFNLRRYADGQFNIKLLNRTDLSESRKGNAPAAKPAKGIKPDKRDTAAKNRKDKSDDKTAAKNGKADLENKTEKAAGASSLGEMKAQARKSPPPLPFRKLKLSSACGEYHDEKENVHINLIDGNLMIRDFSKEKPFRIAAALKLNGKYKNTAIPETEISMHGKLDGPRHGAEGGMNIKTGKASASADFNILPAEKGTIPATELAFNSSNLEDIIPDKKMIKKYGLSKTSLSFKASHGKAKEIIFEKARFSSGGTDINLSGAFLPEKKKGLYPLVLEQIEIAGLKADFIQHIDGSTNMPEIAGFLNWFFAAPSAVDFSIKKGSIKNVSLSYKNEKDDTFYHLENIRLKTENFSENGIFALSLETDGGLSVPGYEQNGLSVSIGGKADLSGLNWKKAYASAALKIEKGGIPLNISAEARNFISPAGSIKLNLSKNTGLLPSFITEKWAAGGYQAYAEADFDFSKRTADFKKISAAGHGSSADLTLNYNWGTKPPAYNAAIKAALDITKLAKDYKFLHSRQAGGMAEIDLKIKNGNADLKAAVSGGQYYHSGAGLFTNINTGAELHTFSNISIDTFTASLNGNPFTFAARLTQKDGKADVSLLLKADKMVLLEDKSAKKKTAASDETPVNANSENANTENKEAGKDSEAKSKNAANSYSVAGEMLDSWLQSVKTADLKTEIAVKNFSSRYFDTKNLLIHSSFTGMDRSMENINGTFLMSATGGGLKAEKNLMTEMKKSHSFILKAINSFDRMLGVWQIVFKIKNIVSSKKSREKAAMAKAEKAAYPWPVDKFLADITVKNGKAAITDFYLTSDILSFKAAGNILLPERQLNLSVRAAAGKAEPDGVLPIKLNITGPFESADASVGKFSTASSIVLQPFLNRGPAGLLKKAFGFGQKKNEKANNYFKNEY